MALRGLDKLWASRQQPREERLPRVPCRAEVRWLVRRRRGRHQAGRPADRRRHARPATTSSWWSPRWATPPTSCSTWPSRSARCRRGASSTCCSPRASGYHGAARDGHRQPGPGGRSFTGSQAGVITDSAHGRARIIDVTPGPDRERARRRGDRDRGRLPGRLPGHQGHHHAGPGRLRHHGGGAGCRAEARTSARSTPTSTGSSPPIRGSCRTRGSIPRSATRRCWRWRPAAQGADAALRRVRPPLRRCRST